jgi:phage tail sheath protein FI
MAFQVSPGVNVTEVDLTTVVPGVSASVGAIAGVFRWGPVGERVLVDSETKLADTFGKPTSLNPETFLTAANFLGYSSALYVVRAANTTASTSSTLTAVANTVAGVNNVSYTAKNRTDYDSKTFANGDVLYIAKYPGDVGNSLRISVVDSAVAYQSNVSLANSTSSVSNATLTIAVGSNAATYTATVAANGLAANAAANTFVSAISVGDVITVGNSSIGLQYMKVTAKGTSTVNGSNIATVSINFSAPYKLAADYAVSGSNTVNTSIQRSWEFFDTVSGAPSTSEYQSLYGNSSAVDTMHVVVVDEDGKFSGTSGAVLEVYQGLSRARDAKTAGGASNYYKNVINDGSRYVYVAGDRTGAASANASAITSSSNTVPAYISFIGGTDGLDESAVAFTDIASAYDLFKSTEQVDVSLILQGKPIGAGSGAQLANYLINNIAEVRKDCVVYVTPPDSLASSNYGTEAQAIVNWKNANLVDSTYSFIDSGYKYMYDRYNDVYRYIPLNGDIAGLTARTEYTNDAWWSPAGFNRGQIKNIVKLRWNPSKTDRDLIYKNAINPVVTFPGQGTILFGDRTGTIKPSAFDRINVRRLFIVLEKAIAQAAKYSLFEFNDDFTRAQFRNLITPYLRDVQSRRGITDFHLVCDETNNTAERIDRNEFWGDIYIKPTRSINFIQLNFVAVRTGVDFTTIIGRF